MQANLFSECCGIEQKYAALRSWLSGGRVPNIKCWKAFYLFNAKMQTWEIISLSNTANNSCSLIFLNLFSVVISDN